MFINRNYDRIEEDDFKINVENSIQEYQEAVPKYISDNGKIVLVGWKLQQQYE